MTIAELHNLFLQHHQISTDTRTIREGSLFFALKGANFNGNTYATEALKKGAAYAIIDEAQYTVSENHILVHDVLATLQQLATYHRKYLNIPIIALTGSNGKTTTKELINCVLATQYQTTATIGNLNNHIGVPLTLLAMDKETEIGIVEMGANHQKEIEFLCAIAQPNYGYITNIGKAHLEGFGGIEGVLKGKTELYQYLQANNQLVFLNADDQKLTKAAMGIKTFTFSQEDTSTDLNIRLEEAAPMVTVTCKEQRIKSNLIGTYNFTNIAAAIAIGSFFEIDIVHCHKAIESYIPANNRSQIITKDHLSIILDAYNANPSSMQAALANFEQQSHPHKIVYLGDMFELGKEADYEHQQLVDYITSLPSLKQIHLIGTLFSKTTTKDMRVQQHTTFDDFATTLNSTVNIPTAILIKGSRGMQLERILKLFNA